jgi:hypothetical protein
MSLFNLPVTESDLTTLQQGIEFSTNTAEATSKTSAINNGAETVFAYAVELLNANLSFSQVAMATTALMLGATASTTTLSNISTLFLPQQVQNAIAHGFDPTVYAAEATGLALAGETAFATFTALDVTQFSQAVATITGVNANPIKDFVTHWIAIYTANPDATFGLSITQAAYGAAFGDALGVALLNPTSANLQTVVTGTTVSGLIANALIDNAEGSYTAGVALGSLPAHQPLQGEGSSSSDTLHLTVNGNVTVDMAQQPATIRTIIYDGQATGSVTINNQTNPLTVNLQDATDISETLTVGSVGPAPGLNDSLTVVIGSTPDSGQGIIGAITVTGDELFTLVPLGGRDDSTGLITLTPTLGGNEQVTIGGDTTVMIGATPTAPTLGAIVDATGGILNVNNLTIKITNTGLTAFAPDSVPGTLLNFIADDVPVGAQAAPSIPYSTNAVTIDASTSGGLFMFAGDANFDPATSKGDVITGAANPTGIIGPSAFNIGNIIGGSIGNDNITSMSLTLPDYIFTDGGADKITLAAGHTGADHVAFYAVSNVTSTLDGTSIVLESVANAISELFPPLPAAAQPAASQPLIAAEPGAFQFVNPGWWGVAAGDSSKEIDTLVPSGTGTSLDNSTLTGFVPNQDFLDFSVSAWGGPDVFLIGLSADTGADLVNVKTIAGLSSDAGVAVNAVAVAPGGSIAGSAATPTDLILLSQGTFLDANAVAATLSNGTYTINHSAAKGSLNYDFLLAYQGLDGNAHIADLHILGLDTTNTDVDQSVVVSDMVTLVGVTLPELLANASHIHLVT